MKIVILDGATAKGRELNFDFLNQFGEVTYYDVTYPDEVLSRAKDADILVINKIVLDRATLSACKNSNLSLFWQRDITLSISMRQESLE